MNARQEADPRLAELRQRVAEAAQMLERPFLYAAEEILGQLLDAARVGFELAGIGQDETQRRALYVALAEYVDIPPPANLQQVAA